MKLNKYLVILAGAVALTAGVLAGSSPVSALSTRSETTGGVANTWTNPSNAGGYAGPQIGAYQTVQIACKLQGFRVADGNTWWYRVDSWPWNDNYYVSADAFYNNGATSGSLRGTPFVDYAVPDCPSASVNLARGIPAPAGYRYAITLSGFAPYSSVSITCYDSASPRGFYSFSLRTNSYGAAFTQSYCYSADGPDHWVVANGQIGSNHVGWGGYGGGGTGGGGTGGGSGSPGTVIGGINVGTPYNSRHRWGACTVQDFSGGPHGHVIVDYTYESTFGGSVVRDGMLAGWLNRGGAPGYGCAMGNERSYGSGRMQDFNVGSLYWVPGQSAGAPFTYPCVFPMRWSKRALTFTYLGAHRYYGNAWQAAKNWSDLGTGITITPSGSSTADIIFVDVTATNTITDSGNWYAQTELPMAWRTESHNLLSSYNTPGSITIEVNRTLMDPQGDYARTFVLTHELGHALGLAHSNACGPSYQSSIMHSGYQGQFNQGFNKPQAFDKIELEELYGIPVS